MPSTARFTVSVQHDSALPRDAIVNTIYLRHNTVGVITGFDTDALAADLAQVYEEKLFVGTALRAITVKAYDTAGPPPHDPVSVHVRNPDGVPVPASSPSEIALCLSFKGGQRPWERGRIFLAPWMTQEGRMPQNISARPYDALMTPLLDLAEGFAGLGGIDIDWVVHSKTHATDTKVQSAWVDDEWDTQRRRGLKATRRLTRNVGA